MPPAPAPLRRRRARDPRRDPPWKAALPASRASTVRRRRPGVAPCVSPPPPEAASAKSRRPAAPPGRWCRGLPGCGRDRKSTRLNSSHLVISYAVFCLKKKKKKEKKNYYKKKKKKKKKKKEDKKK